jgi:hypothetical protein
MVGFDGGRSHAAGFEWSTELRDDHAIEYNAIRNEAIDAADLMGMTLNFHNKDNTMESNGKVIVRITANVFAEAVPYCIGQIVSLNPRVAEELIREKSADLFTPPEKAGIETAAMPKAKSRSSKEK